ncbi:MAG: hydratase [Acidobacteriota bacterium]
MPTPNRTHTAAVAAPVIALAAVGLLGMLSAPAVAGGSGGTTAGSGENGAAGPKVVGAQLAERFLGRRALTPPPALDLKEAGRIRGAFVEHLASELGGVAGYKAALTSRPAQKRLGVDGPLWGTLFSGGLLPSGSDLTPDVGIALMFEPDLMVRVGSTAIRTASTRGEALAALDAVLPFLELPDMPFAAGVKPGAPELVAVNAGVRAGILGEAIPLRGGEGWERRLGTFQVELMDPDGGALGQGRGASLMGHPLDAVLWLRDALAAEGIELQPGQLLSLGSLAPPRPVAPDLEGIRVRYLGLAPDGAVEVSVRFAAPVR